MLPHVRERPVSMQRFNGGIGHPGFFQKDIPKGAPEWVPTVSVPKKGGVVHHVLANETATLVWLANQNCITPHVFTARADRLDRPDRIIWDLDPSGEDEFALVRRTALALAALLREAGSEPFAMVTGSRGIHVVVALPPLVLRAVRDAALAVADALAEQHPDELRRPSARRSARAGCSSTSIATAARRPRSRPTRSARGRARPSRPRALAGGRGRRPAAGRLDARDRPRPPRGAGDPWADLAAAAGALPRLG